MRKHIALTLALLALFLNVAVAQEKPQINVSGSAEVKVIPDEIYLSVGVETRDQELQDAKKQNDDHVSDALAFLKKSGVKDKDVKTDYIIIQPVYLPNDNSYIDSSTGLPVSRSKGALTKPLYYLVRKTIGIKLTDIGSFDNILSGLIASGVNDVQGVEFRTSELRKYRDQARTMAVQAAKEKAQAMATELGVKLGKVNTVNENDWGGWNSWSRNGWGGGGGGSGGMFQNVSQNAGGRSDADAETMSVGQISVSASVGVSFLIE